MDVLRLRVGAATLVRVPYAEVTVDPEVVGLTAADVGAVGWAAPVWADGAGQVRVAAAVWVVESAGRRIVVDPAQAADALLRSGPDAAGHQEAVAAALAAAGLPRESVDTVVLSHVDGIGMAAWVAAGKWRPFFPGAQVLVSRREHDAIVGEGPYRPDGSEALEALHAQGAVTLVDDEHEVTAEVTVRWTGAHSPGHSVVHVKSDGAEATMVGHLALSPIHAALDGCPLHEDPAAAHARLRALRDRGSPLVGPLWPAPGAARWTGTVMEPVPSGDR